MVFRTDGQMVLRTDRQRRLSFSLWVREVNGVFVFPLSLVVDRSADEQQISREFAIAFRDAY